MRFLVVYFAFFSVLTFAAKENEIRIGDEGDKCFIKIVTVNVTGEKVPLGVSPSAKKKESSAFTPFLAMLDEAKKVVGNFNTFETSGLFCQREETVNLIYGNLPPNVLVLHATVDNLEEPPEPVEFSDEPDQKTVVFIEIKVDAERVPPPLWEWFWDLSRKIRSGPISVVIHDKSVVRKPGHRTPVGILARLISTNLGIFQPDIDYDLETTMSTFSSQN